MNCSECRDPFRGITFAVRILSEEGVNTYTYDGIPGNFCSPACMRSRLERYLRMKDEECEVFDDLVAQG